LKKENIRFDYTLSLNLLNRPETVKDLGVIFDRKLSFTSHIDHVVSDSMKQLGFLIRNYTLAISDTFAYATDVNLEHSGYTDTSHSLVVDVIKF
jgi:hypothetical protein